MKFIVQPSGFQELGDSGEHKPVSLIPRGTPEDLMDGWMDGCRETRPWMHGDTLHTASYSPTKDRGKQGSAQTSLTKSQPQWHPSGYYVLDT